MSNFTKIKLEPAPNSLLSQVDDVELKKCAQMIKEAVNLRKKYMNLSFQSFPDLKKTNDQTKLELKSKFTHFESASQDSGFNFRMVDGIMHIEGATDLNFRKPSRDEFLKDYFVIMNLMGSKELDEYCRKRLSYLRLKFDMHMLLNERLELDAQKRIGGVDFYRVHKVDNHIHASCSMTQRHLLDFIRRKLDKSGDMVVVKNYRNSNKPATLAQVFDDLGLHRDELNLDQLGIGATSELFCRFDKFNARFSPFEKTTLRDIFLKVENDIDGQFYAEIIDELLQGLEKSKYTKYELRVSIYGRSYNEWDNLAHWFHRHELNSEFNRWMIQAPKIYDLFKKNKVVDNFGQILANFFLPLFEVTKDPSSHPDLHEFLKHISGFDSVDDESKVETEAFDMSSPKPEQWSCDHNPPYSYYIYYFYANMQLLNEYRARKSMNTFHFRPHCGEAGSVFHLAAGYLLAQNISHGTLLKQTSVLQYLFYLCQIGIATSPSANHYLYIHNFENPFYDFHRAGLNISLSSDSPLHFFFSEEPLLEDFTVLTKLWNLNSVDLCELARASVLMSGYTDRAKKLWLGPNCLQFGCEGNDATKTNLPHIRVSYRCQTLLEEIDILNST